MALFTINRYKGEEDEAGAFNQADELLAKLKQDIANRSKLKRSFIEEHDDSFEVEVEPKQKKKKSKTAEVLVQNGESNDTIESKVKKEMEYKVSEIEEAASIKTPKKSKKKNKIKLKKEDQMDTSNVNDSQLTNGGSSPKQSVSSNRKKQKSKKKKSKSDITPIIGNHNVGGFTVIGKVDAKTVVKVKRVLPDWIKNPTIIENDLQKHKVKVDDVTLIHPKLIEALKKNGIESLFPVQSAIVPWLLRSIGKSKYFRTEDACVSAPTGSGKTLAFVLPVVQALMDRVNVAVRALVVLPVQELATQVFEVFQTYGRCVGLKVALLTGHKSFAEEQKAIVRDTALGKQSLVDILVVTPGKLVDHILKTPGFHLGQLRFLIIDEADRIMAEVKQDWLKFVEQSIINGRDDVSRRKFELPVLPNDVAVVPSISHGLFPSGIVPASMREWVNVPQKLLFSATMSHDPQLLQQLRLFQPKLFTAVVRTGKKVQGGDNEGDDFVGKYSIPAELEEFYIPCNVTIKPLVFYYLLEHLGYRKVLCFTNTLESTRRLYLLVKNLKLNVQAITGQLMPSKRKKTIDNFQKGKIDLIICSDAMARGMDIDNVRHVISYDMPKETRTYVHRVGRTARAGKLGTAVSLLTQPEIGTFEKRRVKVGMEKAKKLEIDESILETYENKFRKALQQVEKMIKKR